MVSSQSIRLYILGKETMESQKEDSVAAGHFDWCTGGHHPNRWHRSSCYGYRHPRLHWTQGALCQHPIFPSSATV